MGTFLCGKIQISANAEHDNKQINYLLKCELRLTVNETFFWTDRMVVIPLLQTVSNYS